MTSRARKPISDEILRLTSEKLMAAADDPRVSEETRLRLERSLRNVRMMQRRRASHQKGSRGELP